MLGMQMSDAIKFCEKKQQQQHKGRESNQSPPFRRSNSPKKQESTANNTNLNNALNQVPYHPNLDFIINMLKKNDVPTQKRPLGSSASANNLS